MLTQVMLTFFTNPVSVFRRHMPIFLMFIIFNHAMAQKSEQKMLELEGFLTLEQLSAIPQFHWKDTASVKFNHQEVDQLKRSINEYTFLVFIGTWCSDTHVLIPQFVKLLKVSNFSFQENALAFYGLRLDKKSKAEFEKPYNIAFVPTIIVLKNGEEIGRIIEKPQQNLLTDLLQIIS